MKRIGKLYLASIIGFLMILLAGPVNGYRTDGLMNLYNISETVNASCGPYWTVNSFEFDKSIIIPHDIVNVTITYTLYSGEGCSYSGNVIYSGVFGNWAPNTEIARTINGGGYGGARNETKTFNFLAPNSSGSYSIRWYFDSTYWPLISYYGVNTNGDERGASAVQKDFNVQGGVGYSATVATGQNTFVQASNGSFGTILAGTAKIINNSVTLNNTGDVNATVDARFNDSRSGVYGLVSGSNVLNATNFDLGEASIGSWTALNETGANVRTATAPAFGAITVLDARLFVPPEQPSGSYSGTVVLTFGNEE